MPRAPARPDNRKVRTLARRSDIESCSFGDLACSRGQVTRFDGSGGEAIYSGGKFAAESAGL